MPTGIHSRTLGLQRLADAEEAAGRPNAARLVRIVAEAEDLLHDPESAPMDPAWDDDDWWRLAGAHDRTHRAEILRTLHHTWAVPQFGPEEAAVLLRLADDEQAASPTSKEDEKPQKIPERSEDDTAVESEAPPPNPAASSRALIPAWATYPLGGITGLALATVVAVVPNYDLKVLSGLLLIVLVLVMAAATHHRGGGW
ncbi:hypothetical protein AB0395_46225 [Streptosporangium sp. NPDC051023]|uniref:hypothetical protein n=1 Tax=Streptosporangium sp. NPDC051023 TaxID=3155410 RepID=UPI00344BBC7C